MSEKYLVIKKNNDYRSSKPLDDDSFEKLKQAALVLESFNTLVFLSSNYEKAKEDFWGYDFTQFNVREIDMFSMFLNALEGMATNRNLWEAYLKRNYVDDSDIYPPASKGKKKKSCSGIKDSESYDNTPLL